MSFSKGGLGDDKYTTYDKVGTVVKVTKYNRDIPTKTAKKIYKLSAKDKQESINKLQNIYKKNGVVVDNNQLAPKTSIGIYTTDQLKPRYDNITLPKFSEISNKLGMNDSDYNDVLNDLKEAKRTSIKTDKGIYEMYTDNEKKWYWYNTNDGNVYSTNNSIFDLKKLQKTNKKVSDLIKVKGTENVYDYINNMNVSDKEKKRLLNSIKTNKLPKAGESKAAELTKGARENQKKYNQLNKTEEVKKQKKDVIEKYKKAAEDYMDYQQTRLNEDNIGWWDKSVGNVVRNLIPFQQFGAEQNINENGDLYYLPSYKELKNQKVVNSYNSIVGKIAGSALQEGGKLITAAATNSLLPGLGTTEYFTDLYTNQLNNAMANGHSSSKSMAYATLSTLMEAATAKVLGGTTNMIFGTGSSEMSNIIGKVVSKITSNDKLVKIISNGIAEGGEEFLQEYLDRLNRNLILNEENKIFSKDTFQDALFSAGVGALTGAGSGAINGGNAAILHGKNIGDNKAVLPGTNNSKSSQGVINIQNGTDSTDEGSVSDQIAELQEQIANLQNQQSQTKDSLKDAQITAQINALQNQIAELSNNIENSTNTNNNLSENALLQQRAINVLNAEKKQEQDNQLNPVTQTTANSSSLFSQTNNTPILPGLNRAQLSNEVKDTIGNTLETSAEINNIDKNTPEYKFAKAFSDRTGVKILFKNKVTTPDGNIVNGRYNPFTKTIELNINSGQSFQQLVTHEITHVLEGTEAMTGLQNFVINYAQSKGLMWQYAYNDLVRNYRPVYGGRADFNSKIESEATAEILGNLINDQEFLNELARSNPSLFKRLYAWINELLARATGDEKAFLRAVKAKFEIAAKELSEDKNKKNTSAGYHINKKISKEVINKYENAKNTIDRKTLLEAANTLDIHYKDGATVIIDENMSKKAGNNKNPQIIDVSIFNRTGKISELTREINNISKDIYTKNKNGYTFVLNVDTNTNFELGNLGIDKTFSKKVPFEKLPTFNKLKEIGEQGIYYRTSYDANKKDGILYHHFLTPVKAINTEGNAFIRTVIKEYTKDSNMNNKFYYHQIEYLDNQKGTTDTSHIGTRTFGNSLYTDNTTKTSKNQAVLPVNSNMQENENNTSYSLPTEQAKDNEGNTLSKSQEKFFKNSKVRDDNGKLKVVYHTTTDEVYQFNEFNPVGTEHYRFGDQVVNYYTDSKDMSGSYAGQDYIMADTKKLTSMKQVEDYIKTMNILGWGSDRKYELIQENSKYKLIDNSEVPNTNKTWQQIYDEANEYKNTLTNEEMAQFKDMFDNEVRTDRVYDIDAYLKSKGYEFGSKQDEIAHKYLNVDNKNVTEAGIYFDVLMRDAKYHAIATYENEQDLYRNLKKEGQPLVRRQYEGYVNITKPYIVDAEERNWNQVVSKSNDFIDELEERVPQDIKDNLTRLYQESATKSDDLRTAYNIAERFVKGTEEYLKINKNTTKMQHVLNRVGLDSINAINDGVTENLGVDTYYGLADVLEQENVIGKETAKLITDDFVIPEQVQKWIKTYLNKKLEVKDLYPKVNLIKKVLGKDKYSLKELYENSNNKYEEFEKYRLPQNYFIEKISSDSSEPGHVDMGYELNDMFETRAEMLGADRVGEEIAQAASVAFSKPELIRLWGTSKTTNDIVKEIIASNQDGTTKYDGVIIKNVYDYGGKAENKKTANDLYITFNSNQFKALDNKTPTKNPDIRYSKDNESSFQDFIDKEIKPINQNKKESSFKDIKLPESQNNNINLPKTNKTLNPIEISKLTKKDANTTPTLPNINRNKSNDEDSKFWSNIKNKTNMLTEEQKQPILDEEEIKYYDTITNKETLDKAFEVMEKDGEKATLNWFGKDSNDASAVDVAEGWILLKQYADNNDTEGMVAVAKKMRDIGTKAGQTVQAFNIMERLTPEGMVKYAQTELSEAYDKMVKNKSIEWINKYKNDFDLTPQEVEAIMDIMQDVKTMDDGYDKRVKLAEIQKIMTDKLPPEKGNNIKAWMRISMLFNPKTQVRNIMGNAIIAPVNSFSDLFASVVDKKISQKTGYRTTGVTNIQNYVKGFKRGIYQSYNDFKKGINTRNVQGNRFEITEGKSFNDKTSLGKKLNQTDKLLSFMLDAGDRSFYEAAFTNSINNQLALNNTTEVTEEMVDIATQEALSRTWQDNNNYTKFVLQTRKALNKINVAGYGLGDILIPFAKTPANLTKAIVDYSPAGMINAIVSGNNLKKSLENGQYTPQLQHKFVQDLGKAVAGTTLYVLGYALAKAGIISGDSDDDKDTKNFMKNTLGINSYSIKIGNKSFTYDWAQPIAAPFSISANYLKKKNENPDAKTLENAVRSLDVAGNILLQQSFMESINTALNNNNGLATGIEEAILELPSRAVPTLMKQIVDLTDGTQRTTFEYDQPLKTSINKVKAKLPGLSTSLEPSVDTMGREIQKYGGKNNLFNVFLNPATVSTENISKSAGEIYRLYEETGDKTIMPRVAPYYINQKGEKIVLNNKQKTEYQKISGSIVEENVQKLLDDKKYKKLNDTEKASVIKSIVDYSYNKARKEVLDIDMSNQYNKVNQYVSQGGDPATYYLNKSEINYALDNPERYAVIKQIADYDKYEKYKSDITTIRNNTSNDKVETIQYINSLNMSVPQKAMFIKLYYPSFKGYDEEIISYINSQPLTIEEKTKALKKLGYKINNGRVYW